LVIGSVVSLDKKAWREWTASGELNLEMTRIKATNVSRCVGCRTCEVICSFTHERECRPALSKIEVHRDPFTGETKIQIGDDCDLCGGRPECIRWCAVGVLKTERGLR